WCSCVECTEEKLHLAYLWKSLAFNFPCMMGHTQLVVVLLLALSSKVSAGPLSRSPCELLPVGEGHPVQALLKSYTALSGCASRGTTSLPHEVHIINLRSSNTKDLGETPEVALHLRPIQSLSVHQKPLIFVLNSPKPFLWRIHADNLAPGIKRVFYVTEDSVVQFEERNLSFSSEVHMETLPHGNEHLMSWAKRQYRAITSFTELKMTHDVYVKVGEDPVFSDTCKIDNKFLSLNYLGSYVQPQASTGCVLSGPDVDQDVHIIELQAPNSSSALQVDVTVDLRPVEPEIPMHRNIVLLLKCDKSVNWVIKAHSIIGKLQIVTSDSVSLNASTERLMQVTKAVKQKLPAGAQALIQWAEENNYNPVTSYTNTAVANIFHLRIREAVKGILSSTEVFDISEFPPELSILRNTDSHEQTHPDLPFFFPPGLDHNPSFPFLPTLEEQELSRRGPEEQRGTLSGLLSVQCEESRMLVSIDKESLQAAGISKANITLQDPQCKATSNATHYILETSLSGCQTTKYPLHNPSPMVLYINSIVIKQSESSYGSGWPSDDEELESGDVLLPERTSSGHHSTIMFNCSYRQAENAPPNLPRVRLNAQHEHVENVTFSMELYNTSLFRHQQPPSFFQVTENKSIYVEISATKADPDLSFMIQTCLISPNSNHEVPSDFTLIENVCPKDESVLYYPQKVDKKRFSFDFRSMFNVPLLFLHCEMSLCSKTKDTHPELPECMHPKEACMSVSADTVIKMMMNSKICTKPLVVIEINSKGDDGDIDNEYTNGNVPDPTTKKPQVPPNDTHIYVLDTPTVVGIAFAAFVIGALLTGALWFIYSHTAIGGGINDPKGILGYSGYNRTGTGIPPVCFE
ncbi:transforming growth factor beta receptor type 3-like, partial [Clarias magur]